MSGGWSILLVLLFVGGCIVAHTMGLNQQRCPHHWHAADPMLAWECCLCHTERDGMPGPDGTRAGAAEGNLADDRPHHPRAG